MILGFGYAIQSLNCIGDELTTIVEGDIPLTQNISLITISQLEQAVSFERSLYYGSKINLSPSYANKFKQTIHHFDQRSEVIEQAASDAIKLTQQATSFADETILNKFEQIRTQITQLKIAHETYVEHAHKVFTLLEKGNTQLAEPLIIKVEIEEESLDAKSEALLNDIQSFTKNSALIARAHEVEAVRVLFMIAIICFVGAIILSQLLSRYIITGIKIAIVTATGDFTQEIKITSKDEIGQLLMAMNSMRGKLMSMIQDISCVTAQLSDASQKMSNVTSQTSEVINQQRSETELVSIAMNQMTSTSRDVSGNISQTASHAFDATKQTVAGSKVVDTAVSEINKLSDQIAEAAVTIKELEQHSDNINSVMDVIKGIAEQTNLLALNAAIEAARAGEQGRGFAVVADEVRTLAVRTQESTKEINAMIDKLQVGTRAAVNIMEKSRNQTDTAVECARQSGEAFTVISTSVNQISTMCEQIASAAEEQGLVSEEISKNIVDINEMSSQTASGAQETSDASKDLANMSSQLKVLVGNFAV